MIISYLLSIARVVTTLLTMYRYSDIKQIVLSCMVLYIYRLKDTICNTADVSTSLYGFPY